MERFAKAALVLLVVFAVVCFAASWTRFLIEQKEKNNPRPCTCPASAMPTDAEVAKEMRKYKLLLAVQPGCPPCKRAEKLFLDSTLPIPRVVIDISRSRPPFAVTVTPTLVQTKDGREVMRWEGADAVKELEKYVPREEKNE